MESLAALVTHPLTILLVGLVTVVGMILVLRANAFVALITAAILVSLLAPGAMADKVSRVAGAFGSAAGKIGVVIALAAVIGKCMMDSGAADRIVRSFLRVLGDRRAPVALAYSGFVLSIPVFFDTVFYLTVPLARSLFRQTRKDYLLYILAIGAGAIVTHVMVPPTPGPLLIAATLDIDLGVMILTGVVLGIPTAIIGLLVARWLNRHVEVPMRPYPGEVLAEPLSDAQLPALWLSLAPVLLPVILISANTATQVAANAEHQALVQRGELLDWASFSSALAGAQADNAPEPLRRVAELLPGGLQERLARTPQARSTDPALSRDVQAAVRDLVRDRSLCLDPAFAGVPLPDAARRLLDDGARKLPKQEQDRFNKLYRAKALAGTAVSRHAEQSLAAVLEQLSPQKKEELNWLVLEAAFPQYVRPTGWRRVDGLTDLVGNANFALLLSAVLAMGILVRQRRLTFAQLSQATEEALMSAGVIILITAAGGAFGAMLGEARVGPMIEQWASSDGGHVGMAMLWIAFGVAAVIKIAQGSSTVAMITTAGMMQSMGVSADLLGFHPVYLAIAIACGSLVFCWMNDSGFWVVVRMSGMTEREGLKAWTTLTAAVGCTGMAVTAIAAWLVPLH